MGNSALSPADEKVELRPATLADVESMFAIESASFSDPWSRYALAGVIGSPGTLVTVAVLARPDADAAEVGGYSVVARAADEAELLNLAVAVAARGRGLGVSLLERAIADAKAWGAEAIYLEVRASNAAALALYQRAGFREAGRRRGYYRRPSEDALILRRELLPGRNDDTRTPSLARIW